VKRRRGSGEEVGRGGRLWDAAEEMIPFVRVDGGCVAIGNGGAGQGNVGASAVVGGRGMVEADGFFGAPNGFEFGDGAHIPFGIERRLDFDGGAILGVGLAGSAIVGDLHVNERGLPVGHGCGGTINGGRSPRGIPRLEGGRDGPFLAGDGDVVRVDGHGERIGVPVAFALEDHFLWDACGAFAQTAGGTAGHVGGYQLAGDRAVPGTHAKRGFRTVKLPFIDVVFSFGRAGYLQHQHQAVHVHRGGIGPRANTCGWVAELDPQAGFVNGHVAKGVAGRAPAQSQDGAVVGNVGVGGGGVRIDAEAAHFPAGGGAIKASDLVRPSRPVGVVDRKVSPGTLVRLVDVVTVGVRAGSGFGIAHLAGLHGLVSAGLVGPVGIESTGLAACGQGEGETEQRRGEQTFHGKTP